MALPPPACRVAGGGFFLAMKALLTQSAKHALDLLMRAHPGVVTIAGTQYKCAAVVSRGPVDDAKGGFKQVKTAAFHLPYSSINEATLIALGKNKRLTITHDADSFRISSDGIKPDPLKTRWIIRAEQAVN